MSLLTEHSIKLNIKLPKGDVSADMEVFYNPVMISNRNISILLLNSLENTEMNIVDHLAGSGIRSLRFLKELKKKKINHLFINDKKIISKKYFVPILPLTKFPKSNKNKSPLEMRKHPSFF